MKLRIKPDGTIQGLWTDDIDFIALGRSAVRRASHVEFDERRQLWTVREAVPRGRFRRWMQVLLGRPCGRVLYRVASRRDALAWEQTYFGPGGEGWIAESIRKAENAKAASVNRRHAVDLAAHG